MLVRYLAGAYAGHVVKCPYAVAMKAIRTGMAESAEEEVAESKADMSTQPAPKSQVRKRSKGGRVKRRG